MKHRLKNLKKAVNFKQLLTTSIVAAALFVTAGFAGHQLFQQAYAQPANPIQGMNQQASEKVLKGSNGESAETSEKSGQEETKKNKEDKEKDKNKEGKNKENDAKKQQDSNGHRKNSDVKIIDYDENRKDAVKVNEYFTTTIKQNEVVTQLNYEFSIIQKDHGLEIKSTEVLVNGLLNRNFQGKVRLKEGKNDITVKVTYLKKNKKPFTVSKDYTVYANPGKIAINTDLKDGYISKTKQMTFEAYASYGGEKLELKAACGGQNVEPNPQNRYTFSVDLQPGDNTIDLHASAEGKSAQKTYKIRYANEKAEINFGTDLKDQEVAKEEFQFQAYATTGKGERTDIFVSCNGKEAEPRSKDNYTVTLREGNNTIRLKASDGNKSRTVSYKIVYKDPTPGAGEAAKKKPVFATDLKDGETIIGNTKDFYVKATDYKGNHIRGSSITVKCNGKNLGVHWDDNEQTTYKAALTQGQNSIVIQVKDEEGNTASARYKLFAQIKKDGEVIGNITISVEATTVGLGHLVPAEKVEIKQGETVADALVALLEKHGYGCGYKGGTKANFYLESVKKSGISANAKIPEDLRQLLLEKAEWQKDSANSPNQLGEYDFTNGSGWMYSVNDTYPNYSMSEYDPKNGDKVRVRFTTFYGCDIGGAGTTGGSNSGDGSTKNWGKQW